MNAVTPMLEARALVKHLGGRRVVDGVDLVCRPGRDPRPARAQRRRQDDDPPHALRLPDPRRRRDPLRGRGHPPRSGTRAKRFIGVCTQDDTFDGDFTVEQNLLIAAEYFRPRPDALRERVAELLARFELGPYARQKPETLSGGYRRRLMLARAIVHRPRLLFLDEPTTGLDPQARVAVWQLVDGLRAEGLAIVLTTHYMDEAERLSDVLTVLARGRVVAHGTPKAVLGDSVGEHVVVVAAAGGVTRPSCPGSPSRGLREPATVLGDWHVPLSAEALAEFARAFPHLRYEVRGPTLDDLFLKLALEP